MGLGSRLLVCGLMQAALCTGAAGEEADEDEPPPSARQILQSVVLGLPQDTLQIEGAIRLRRQKGFVERKLLFTSKLEWGETPSRATYTIRDALGRTLEQMSISRGAGGDAALSYMKGDPPADAAKPALTSAIQGTQLTWLDLTFSFLWWPDAAMTAIEHFRGEACYVLDIPVPPEQPMPGTQRIRLWVARKAPILLKAEALDPDGKTVRRMEMEGFKKINDQWMVKEIVVRGTSRNHRTELKIEDVKTVTKPGSPTEP